MQSHPRHGGGSVFRTPRLFLLALLALTLVAGSAWAYDGPTLDELRERAKTEGWTFDVDDTFILTRTQEERDNLRGYKPPAGWESEWEAHLEILPVEKALPTSLDWRDVDGITPVKNQGSCGSCWAFAATAEMEAFIKIYYGVEVNLSEQQSISCNPYGAGCDGGWAVASYYIWQNYGGVLENCHPYLSADPPIAPCEEDNYFDYAHITGYRSISNNVEQMKQALQVGPICTAIDASPEFENYGGGCYNLPGYGTNHLVLIVGYDDRACSGNGAWIIKNSWGSGFGESGYAMVQYGAGNVGISVTQMYYTPPPVEIDIDSAFGLDPLLGDETVTLNWTSAGAAAPTVDIWMGIDGACHDLVIAENVPNSGSYDFFVPNEGTDYASLVVFPSTGTVDGYDFAKHRIQIVGHKIRYVSTLGSNTAPYETPATAAHSIADALVACTGTDSVYVAGGDYAGAIAVTDPVRLFGGWNDDFSVRDTDLYPTRLSSGNGGLRFLAGCGDIGGVDGFVFEDCVGANYSNPVPGYHGGAIYTSDCSPTISNCRFLNNRADPAVATGYGGALCLLGGEPRVIDCEFTGNIASNGGAVAVLEGAAATLENCAFTGNACSDSLPSFTGAGLMVQDASIHLVGGSLVDNGGSGVGGALWASNATVSMDGVEIRGNRSQNAGGALSIDGGTLELVHCTLENNTARGGNGGAVFASLASVQVRNTRLVGNSATNLGGGLYGMNINGTVENCLVDSNSGSMAGGLAMISGGALTARNNIIVSNVGGGLMCAGTGAVSDCNDAWSNAGGDFVSTTMGPGDISVDPLLVDLTGGDLGLAVHSPCLDRGIDDPGCLDPDGSRADIGFHGGPDADFVAPPVLQDASVVSLGAGQYRFSWTASAAPDLDHYVVYRDTADVFVPTANKMVGSVVPPTTTWDDTPPQDSYYVVVAVDVDGHSSGFTAPVWTQGGGSSPVEDSLPRTLAIRDVTPNPFNPLARISYDVPRTGNIRLEIFDLRGRRVRTLVDETVEAGTHTAIWKGRDDQGRSAAAGIYFARMSDGRSAQTAKMVLAK